MADDPRAELSRVMETLLGVLGGGAMSERQSAAPVGAGPADVTADVVVVGGGGGGLPAARAYWAGGATLGPIIAFAYRAAKAAHREPVPEEVARMASPPRR